MMHKLTFDKKKYFNDWFIKIVLILIFYVAIFLVIIILSDKSSFWIILKIFLLILVLSIGYFSSRCYIDYKYYQKDNFKFTYDNNSISYYHLRFTNFFEGFTALSSNYVRISLESTKIDRVELKKGKIYIFGLMTFEKEATKLKQKIIKKFSFPDYFVETETFVKEINKYGIKKD